MISEDNLYRVIINILKLLGNWRKKELNYSEALTIPLGSAEVWKN